MQAIFVILFFLGLGAILRSMIAGGATHKLSSDRVWLNSLKDANKEFTEIWGR